MHEAAFAQAAWPRKAVILKLPLKDFSNVHALWLERLKNPLLTGENVERRHVIEAVMICCHTYEELLALDYDPLLRIKSKIWGWRIRNEDFALAAAELRNYIAEGSTEPIIDDVLRAGESQRSPGSPFILRLIQFLILKLGKTESEAMNYKCGLAKWHYCGYWESEGSLRVKNEGEMEFDRFVAEQEAIKFAELKAKGVICPA